MAQAAAQVGTVTRIHGARSEATAPLSTGIWGRLSTAYRNSRERENLGRMLATADIGRATGVKC